MNQQVSYCSNCGSPIPQGSRFCANCGSPAAQPGAGGYGVQPVKKRKSGKLIAIIVVAVLVLVTVIVAIVGASGKSKPVEEPAKAPISTIADAPAVEAPAEAPVPAETPASSSERYGSSSDAELDEACDLICGVIADSYDYCRVYHEDGIVMVDIAMDGVTEAISTAKSMGYDSSFSAWVDVKTNMLGFYDSVVEVLNSLGITDHPVVLSLRNDLNTENTLLMVMYDEVIYDIMEE